MKNPKLISVIGPVYNEGPNLTKFYAQLKNVLNKLPQYRFEVIFVNDGSSDNSLAVLNSLATTDNRIIVVDFSRNFGKEVALTAGLDYAGGDAAIMVDTDLQHPLSLIPKFLEKWEAGAEVVVGVRSSNKGEGWIKRVGSKLFYKAMNSMSEFPLIPHATDFRLLDRIVVDEFKRFTERNRITRGLVDWLGFSQEFIYFQADARSGGTAGYSLFKLARLALNSVVALSLLPLRVAGYLGLFITAVSGGLGLFMFIEKFIRKSSFGMDISGPDMLAVMLVFMSGIILICLGFIALYIAHIHAQVANRPLYVVRKRQK